MNDRKHSLITVIVPTYNEEEGIGPTIEEIREILHNPNVLVIDGHSADRTVEIAERLGAKVVPQNGKGKGRALAQILRHVDADTKYMVLIDADFTYPAEHIPAMVKILEERPDVGMVIGNRFHPKFVFRKAVNNLLYFGNRTLAFTQYLINGVKLDDPLSGLRVLRWEVIKDWKPKSDGFDIEAEMNHYVKRRGYRTLEVPIRYRQRLGEKKLRIEHGLTILRRILLESLVPQD